MRLSSKDAQKMADLAGRGQDVEKELRLRALGNAGLRVLRPNAGESLFIYCMRTIAPDLLNLRPMHDVEVFPDAQDKRRVDFSFLPIAVVIEIQGSVHQTLEYPDGTVLPNALKLEKDCKKLTDLQLAGAIVVCCTPHQLEHDPWPVMEATRRAIKLQEGKTCSLVHKQCFGEDY